MTYTQTEYKGATKCRIANPDAAVVQSQSQLGDQLLRYYCKCGQYFGNARWLTEHIGICNPHWPRSSPNDEHSRVTEEQWREIRNALPRV